MLTPLVWPFFTVKNQVMANAIAPVFNGHLGLCLAQFRVDVRTVVVVLRLREACPIGRLGMCLNLSVSHFRSQKGGKAR